MYYIYIYLDPRKLGSYSYGEFHFEYEPFYVGKGTGDRMYSHLRIANSSRKGKNNLIITKIKSILNDGSEPIILKIMENLTKENYDIYEISIIKLIGKLCNNEGPLLNTTDGVDGGITWHGDHHNKGKKLEEIVGEERSIEIRKYLSEIASKRIGDKNSNYGNRGELSAIYGFKNPSYGKSFSLIHREKISNSLKRYRDSLSDEFKQEWYKNQSVLMKEKYENGELFSDEHRQKLKETNFKKLNKGSDVLKLSQDHKDKISNTLKGRIFSDEHRQKLRTKISYEEFEIIIPKLIEDGLFKNITQYRKFAKENPGYNLSSVPEKSYKNCGWSGWPKYFQRN